LVLLAGCGAEQHGDLKQELADLTKDFRGHVDPLPEPVPYEPAQYTAEGLIDPFRPERAEVATAARPAASARVAPDPNRSREVLEGFALDSIKVVGTILRNGQWHAVVRAGGNLYTVRKGNYVGPDFGVVTEVTATQLSVTELVQESSGDWMERRSLLPFGDLAQPQQIIPVDVDHVVPVLFATNRRKTGVNQPDRYFSNDEAAEGPAALTLGRLLVRVPHEHTPGNIEQPGWVRLTIEKLQPSLLLDALGVAKFSAEDRQRHFTFAYPIEELTPGAFRKEVRTMLQSSRSRSALVFVHGYANSFKDAAYRTAQLSFDLRLEGFDALPLFFSWPSDPALGADASGFNYLGAKDRIRSASEYLAHVLHELLNVRGFGVVHIIAHSMGAEVLALALTQLGESKLVVAGSGGRKSPRFNQVILAAPDIRVNDFRKLVRPAILSGHRVTNYASSNDAALQLSKKGNASLRAGDTTGGPIAVTGIETIDASAVNDQALGHSFFAQSPAMIRDLVKLLRDNASPQVRGLEPIRRAAWTYWQFSATPR
jgi:esterase/lipase superfamily enzyme/Tfp pilus assembly protein PilP